MDGGLTLFSQKPARASLAQRESKPPMSNRTVTVLHDQPQLNESNFHSHERW